MALTTLRKTSFCITGVERVWRLGDSAIRRWHLPKKLLTDLTTSLHPPSEAPTCTRPHLTSPHHAVGLQHERIDCVSKELGSNRPLWVLPGSSPHGTTSAWRIHLAGRIPLRSLGASLFVHPYNNSAWRICCLHNDVSNEPRCIWLLHRCPQMTADMNFANFVCCYLYLSRTRTNLRFA